VNVRLSNDSNLEEWSDLHYERTIWCNTLKQYSQLPIVVEEARGKNAVAESSQLTRTHDQLQGRDISDSPNQIQVMKHNIGIDLHSHGIEHLEAI
jgi:hypothetical protein